MSRTVRRVGKRNNPKQECWYVEKDNYVRTEGCTYRYTRRELKQGKDYMVGWWKFHRDSYKFSSHCYYRKSWSQVRNQNSEDLSKWIKDENHEPIFFEYQNRKDWD